MAHNVPVLLPIVKPILNIPLSIPPSRRGQGLEAGAGTNLPLPTVSLDLPRIGQRFYDLVIEEASRIGTFFTCLDFKQFDTISGNHFPRDFNLETFKNMVVEAFQAPQASINQREAQVIIDAKVRLKKCLKYMHQLLGLFATAGLYKNDVLESLTWLSKMNKDSYLELIAKFKIPTSRSQPPIPLSQTSTKFQKTIPKSSKMRTTLDVKTAREMAAKSRQAGGKLEDNETPLYSNPDPLLKYRHPQWNI